MRIKNSKNNLKNKKTTHGLVLFIDCYNILQNQDRESRVPVLEN